MRVERGRWKGVGRDAKVTKLGERLAGAIPLHCECWQTTARVQVYLSSPGSAAGQCSGTHQGQGVTPCTAPLSSLRLCVFAQPCGGRETNGPLRCGDLASAGEQAERRWGEGRGVLDQMSDWRIITAGPQGGVG